MESLSDFLGCKNSSDGFISLFYLGLFFVALGQTCFILAVILSFSHINFESSLAIIGLLLNLTASVMLSLAYWKKLKDDGLSPLS
jgi:hypothetical protein